jgi:RNA polymerase sigma-70 factor, ECF subfamily
MQGGFSVGEEQRLITRAVCGEPSAFSELYLKHHGSVFRYAYSLVGHREEAEDVAAETFLRAWKAIGRFDDRGYSILSWLLKIAHNHVIRNRRHVRPMNVDDFKDVLVDDDLNQSPELLAELQSSSYTLRRAILALPIHQRQLVVLRFLNELSYEEVGRIIGKSNGAVRVMQHRALRALKHLVSDDDFVRVRRQMQADEPRARLRPMRVEAGL